MEIRAEGVARRFFRNGRNTNYFYAVRKTDFTLKGGTVAAVAGRSGSGKTTFANLLGGLLRPTEGSVLYDGRDLFEMDEKARSRFRAANVGFVPQGLSALQNLTVLENVTLPACFGGGGDRERAMALLGELGIADLADVYAGELSGGEARRMSIARALLPAPGLIIADEPTGDLDPASTTAALGLLRKAAENGAGVLIVTHDPAAVGACDLVYAMENGVLSRE